jgi:hypothetical protein
MLEGQLESMEAKIFINHESLNEAIKLAENPNTNSIYEYDTLYQLCQLRTRSIIIQHTFSAEHQALEPTASQFDHIRFLR